MRENEARLKQLEKELNDQKMADHLAKSQAKHEYYRTHGEKDMDFEEWEKLTKDEKDKYEKERKKSKSELKERPTRESKDYEKLCDFGCNYISTYVKDNPDMDREEFIQFVSDNNKADRDSGELQDISKEEIERLGKEFKKTQKVNETYQADLSPYKYMNPRVNDSVLSVGWLEKGKEFPRGDVPEGFLTKLSKLKKTNHTKGWHECPFCERPESVDGVRRLGPRGSCELTVTDNGITYLAPELITHYVKEHNYLPPKQYIDAVMLCRTIS